MTTKNIYFLLLILILSACSSDDKPNPQNPINNTPTSTVVIPVVEPESEFNDTEDLGKIENNLAIETSGIVASSQNKDMFWIHNDSGDAARIFLINKNGKDGGTFSIEGATNQDWEDIAMATFADGSYLYLADIGDNTAVLNTYSIYRVKEPKINTFQAGNYKLSVADRIVFRYPDGSRDAETLMIDPKTKDLYIVSKRENRKRIYTLKYPNYLTGINTAEFLTEINASVPVANDETSLVENFITSGAISPDNKEIVLRSYTKVFYWKRKTADESITDVLKRAGRSVPYMREPQGEAITWAADGSGYLTTSEQSGNTKASLFFYKKK
jgi:hypothetical protein